MPLKARVSSHSKIKPWKVVTIYISIFYIDIVTQYLYRIDIELQF